MSTAIGTKMASRNSCWRSAQLGSLAALLNLTACSTLLGIEDVHQGPAPGSVGAGGSGGDSNLNGGTSALGGDSSGGDSTGGDGSAAANAGGASGKGGAAGLGGAGGAGAGGMSGAGGTGSGVQGHVIDYWGHHLAGVPVEIGGQVAMTDAQGAFSFANIPTEYDVSLVVSFQVTHITQTRGWVFQGLTRRDPTLQIYQGLEDKETALDVSPNSPSTLTDTRTLTVALGGPDGSTTYTGVSGPGLAGATALWQGPDTTQETAHALIFERDPNTDFPTKFIAFDSTLVALSSTGTVNAKASFDLSADNISTGTIVGTVAGSGLTARSNSVFLRFNSNATLSLLSHTPTTAGFSYLVPNLTGATTTFAASDGDVYGEYGLVHKDGLVPGTAMINATIPTPAKTLIVIPSTDVNKINANTKFSFKAGGAASAPFVAVFTHTGADDLLYVVSAKAPFTLPKVVNGMYAPQPGEPYYWRVETHGAPASVDAMAGPTGFLDSFSESSYADFPSGPRSGDGSYTLSLAMDVKIAP